MKSLIPWRRGPLGTFEGFRQEMEDLFQRFWGESLEGDSKEGFKVWTPRVDVEESDKEILVKVDLPGVDPKNIEISVAGDTLILRGERKEEREEKKKNYHRVERFVGEFYRELPLPAGADPEKITATSAKGVVSVSIPKKPGAQPKKIAVKAQD